MREGPVGRVLEVGCGAGALLADLASYGFELDAIETSQRARYLASMIHAETGRVRVHDAAKDDWFGMFDWVLALEVLEHIENDREALRNWHTWLKPEGRLVLSVPAHPGRWNASDVWAGHYRRYTRHGLQNLLNEAGFRVWRFECYGFPLSNIIEPVRARFHARAIKSTCPESGDNAQRATGTERSGTDRNIETRLYPLQASWLGTKLIQLSCQIQNLFLHTDLGTGFLVLAQPRSEQRLERCVFPR